MLELSVSSAFKTEVKKIKSAKDKAELKLVLDLLLNEQPLPKKYKDHCLSGNYKNYRECHIKPDLLLIYKVVKEELVLYAVHIGSHSDLFKK
ncbi:MAG: type II toxin-antitoxin system YafQ family toxin [Alphaproteobacteria bacterium]|nr:type II toxin-antitoxin system YafQ family toxin [Alphaproteobacteria bacterium]